MSHAAVTRELLVRYLGWWVPATLHSAPRAVYLDANATPASAEPVLDLFAEPAAVPARRRLTVVLGAADEAAVLARVAAVRARLGPAPGVHVLVAPPGPAAPPMPAGTPLLAFLDTAGGPAPEPGAIGALLAGGRADALLVLDPAGLPDGVEAYRAALTSAGAPLVTCVEAVDRSGGVQVLCFATDAAKHLESFKDELWAVDEYAGIRYRDPRDPERALLDISLSPHPGPLRRALLGRLAAGPRTVDELRGYAVAETVYRAADVNRAITALLAAKAVLRTPGRGRLTGDTRIASADRAA